MKTFAFRRRDFNFARMSGEPANSFTNSSSFLMERIFLIEIESLAIFGIENSL